MGQQGINNFVYPQLTSYNADNPANSPGNESSLNPNKFDIQKFNKEFENKIEQSKETGKLLDENRLEKLNKQKIEPKPYQLSIAEILIVIKDSWFGLLDDLLQEQFYMETFTKKNRMFYIGLTIVIIVIIFYLYDIIIDNFMSNSSSKSSDSDSSYVSRQYAQYASTNNSKYDFIGDIDMDTTRGSYKKIIEIHHIYHK